MTKKTIFDILLLIARPAAGKSEIIDYLKGVPPEERARRFHVGNFDEIDDFPMIWSWFEQDALLDKMGRPRLHTDSEGYFLQNYFWDLLIERIGLEYQKRQRDLPQDAEPTTTLIEFSRGSAHGGYRSAFSHLSRPILAKAALLYVDVTWEESLRKNRKRFNPDKPGSILEHSLSDEKMERLYKETDWDEFSRVIPITELRRGGNEPPSSTHLHRTAFGAHLPRTQVPGVQVSTTPRSVPPGGRVVDGPAPGRHTDDMSRQCYISVQGIRVPYVVFDNSDDVTTRRGEALGSRLEGAFKDLWTLYSAAGAFATLSPIGTEGKHPL